MIDKYRRCQTIRAYLSPVYFIPECQFSQYFTSSASETILQYSSNTHSGNWEKVAVGCCNWSLTFRIVVFVGTVLGQPVFVENRTVKRSKNESRPVKSDEDIKEIRRPTFWTTHPLLWRLSLKSLHPCEHSHTSDAHVEWKNWQMTSLFKQSFSLRTDSRQLGYAMQSRRDVSLTAVLSSKKQRLFAKV